MPKTPTGAKRPDDLSKAAGLPAQSEFDHLKRQEQEIRKRIRGFSAGDQLSRDELYDRNLGRQKR